MIKDKLDGGFLADVQEDRKNHQNFEKKVGVIFDELEEKFQEETNDRQTKLKNALLFEANIRLMKHPYDLIGLRRFKLFEDSLKNYINKEENWEQKKTFGDSLKEKITQCLDLNDNGMKFRLFKVLKIIAGVALVTLLVNVNDYYQDFNVIWTFWRIGYNRY